MSQDIAENIRRVMVDRGIDANALALRLGYRNRATIDHWLSGRRLPTPDNLRRVAEVLGVPVETLDPSGAAYNLNAPRGSRSAVDNPAEVGRIPYSTQDQRKGLTMRDFLRRLDGALSIVPVDLQEQFVLEVQDLAARKRLHREDAGVMPAKQKRVAGKG